jgi:ABC-type branched-subunit amino acid transport system substrate-binding protein
MRSRALVRSHAASLCACLSAIALAGCGNATTSASQITVSGSKLTVYASQPPSGSGGQTAADTLDAEQLALQQAGSRVAGKFTVRLVQLDGRELSDNARTAIQDQTAIAYLGELQPGTSQISTAILNQQGLLEVSPADTAVYLTQPPTAGPESVTTLYPARSTYHDTFARVVPNSGQEAKALVAEMQSLHVSRVYVTDDGQDYSAAIALEVAQAAKAAGLTETQGPATSAAVRASGAGALFYGGTLDSPGAARSARTLLESVSASLPAVKLFAPSGLYNESFVSGLTAATQARLVISSPGFLTRDLSSQGHQFVTTFTSTFGHAPVPQAIFGYAAMQAVLTVLDDAGAHAGNRAEAVARVRTLKTDQSVLGPYSIAGGDPSIAPFVFAHSQHGKLVPFAKG